jgi:HlyD family secretion protein
MKKYWLLLILPILLLIWWGVGHGGSAPQVHFSTVRRVRIESTISTNGKAEPAQWAAARAEVAGLVKNIEVQQGQTVRQGETLVTLDRSTAQAGLANALAREQEAQAQQTTLVQGGRAATLADLNDSIATQRNSLDIARRNYESLQRLASQQAATKQQVQEAHDAVERTSLQLQALEDQKQTLVTAIDKRVAQARLEDAQAAVSVARHQLQLGKVASPLTGTIYQFNLKVGAYLQPGELVALVGNLDQMKVTVYVDEPDLGRVGLGMPVQITWDATPGQKWAGRVERLPTEVVALQSRTVGEVSTIVENPNHDLLPGVSVNALIVSKVVADAVSVPKAALRTINGQDGVYKLAGEKILWTPVKPGISDINNVQILSGVSLGDKVADRMIEPPDAEFKNGMRVKAVID